MANAILEAKNLNKSFRYQKRGEKSSWFNPEYVTVQAVHDLSLTIKAGERVAFVGPNGAGKSTSIKMFSGILNPTSGNLKVCGLDPVKDRRELSYKIGCVFGQRSQLLPNLPLSDSLELFGHMYDLSKQEIMKRSHHLKEVFELNDFIDQPVRQLSLGQRMRGEIAASLMHRPKIIFLDEPTIGLDVVAKRELRHTLTTLNENEGTTIFLTSHDTGDIESLSERLIVIDQGGIIIDSPTKDLQKTYLSKKYFKIDYASDVKESKIKDMGFVLNGRSVHGYIDTSKQNMNTALKKLMDVADVEDIHLYDEQLEDIIIDIYNNSKRKKG